jgi:hypothetical protein
MIKRSALDHRPLDADRTAEEAGEAANAAPKPQAQPVTPRPDDQAKKDKPGSKFHG